MPLGTQPVRPEDGAGRVSARVAADEDGAAESSRPEAEALGDTREGEDQENPGTGP